MSLTEAIETRRAVRAYERTPVDEATVRELLRMAVQAPSAMNAQGWGFCVVQDRAVLARYSDRAKALLLTQVAGEPKARHYQDLLGNPSFNIFYDAGTLIVICAMKRGPYAAADCWLAAQNLMLAACAKGLGSCPIGFANAVLDTPEVRAELGIPAEGMAVAAIIVGVPAAAPPPVPRSEPRILTWKRS